MDTVVSPDMLASAPDFAGRVALVTGGGSGIGLATAVALARAGVAAVVITGRRVDAASAAAEEVRGAGADCLVIQADIANPSEAERVLGSTVERFGRLDIAFNNAGFQERRTNLADQDDATFTTVFDTNVRAVFHCMRLEIRAMLAGGAGGVIINNASVSGTRNPNAGLSLYSASKAAVISLTRSAAMEYAARGIRINAVSPGRVVTDMMLRSGIADLSQVAAGLPLKRMGQPNEVANAVLWLASNASSFVVGHVLCVDGGFLAQ